MDSPLLARFLLSRAAFARATCYVRWRSWIARYVIVALVLPALGPLPWLVADAAAEAHAAAAHHAHGHDHGHEDGAPHHHGPSSAPGSPAHPDDHNCLACQVLAHLGALPASWAPQPQYTLATCAVTCGGALVTLVSSFAPVPPARGPPLRDA